MTDSKITFKSKDGIKINGVWHQPQKKRDKLIIFAHGITVDKDEDGLFINLADRLQSLGFNVLRFDFRGHGLSEEKSEDMTIKGELLDLESAVNYAIKKGFKKIGLLGASFGGVQNRAESYKGRQMAISSILFSKYSRSLGLPC